MKLYFAGPLFSEAERNWIRNTKKEIETLARERGKEIHLVWPYELISQEEIDSLGDMAKREIFLRCKSQLEDSDILIALLDGAQVDDGTAWEIGYFYRMRGEGSLVIGVRTDFRNAGEGKTSVVNAMIECSCDRIARSTTELLQMVAEVLGF
jgi:nucleoside 2-deoxyribosyltransferase